MGLTLTKSALVDDIQKRSLTPLTKEQIGAVLTAMQTSITENVLHKGCDVLLQGFGRYSCKKTAAKTMKTSVMTKSVTVPARRTLKFTASSASRVDE